MQDRLNQFLRPNEQVLGRAWVYAPSRLDGVMSMAPYWPKRVLACTDQRLLEFHTSSLPFSRRAEALDREITIDEARVDLGPVSDQRVGWVNPGGRSTVIVNGRKYRIPTSQLDRVHEIVNLIRWPELSGASAA